MKKLFIVINVILLLTFSYRLYALHADLSHGRKGMKDPAEQKIKKIRRPAAVLPESYENFLKAMGTEISEKVDSNREPGSSALNQLVMENAVIRLRGIFIQEDMKNAWVSITAKGKKGIKQTEEWEKVGVGDKVRGLAVIAIEPGHIGLSRPSSETAYLRIFKDEVSTDY